MEKALLTTFLLQFIYKYIVVAMFGTDVVRLLHAGAVRGDGGICLHCIRIRKETENAIGRYLWSVGLIVPTLHKDCAGAHDVECG